MECKFSSRRPARPASRPASPSCPARGCCAGVGLAECGLAKHACWHTARRTIRRWGHARRAAPGAGARAQPPGSVGSARTWTRLLRAEKGTRKKQETQGVVMGPFKSQYFLRSCARWFLQSWLEPLSFAHLPSLRKAAAFIPVLSRFCRVGMSKPGPHSSQSEQREK